MLFVGNMICCLVKMYRILKNRIKITVYKKKNKYCETFKSILTCKKKKNTRNIIYTHIV